LAIVTDAAWQVKQQTGVTDPGWAGYSSGTAWTYACTGRSDGNE
jgi:hypothetical protein